MKARIDIDMTKVYAGEPRFSVGYNCDMVLVRPGEPGYENGKVVYRVEPSGADVEKINIISAIARIE